MKHVKVGIRENWQQFSLLVLVNAFVGAMVGIERAVLPLLAEQNFGIASHTAVLSFIATFGLTKALANLAAGRLGDRFGRRHVLIAGWLFGLPVPIMLMLAPSWTWVVVANIFLGINQGLAWSTTVIMKIDLAGPEKRGLAMGLNESAGYVAVSLAALGSAYVAAAYSLSPHPFYLGVAFSLAGLLLSVFWIRDTSAHADVEARDWKARPYSPDGASGTDVGFARILLLTSWKDRTLFSVSQAGMVNNLNDGVAWGLFPLYFAGLGHGLGKIGLLVAIYPAVWGLGQLITGPWSDRLGRKPMIVAGMLVQASGLALMLVTTGFNWLIAAMVLLGTGTALVYPTLLATIGDAAHPSWRASSVGVYRLWRDGGYVIGALVAGILADSVGIIWAIGAVAALTATSGIISGFAMKETLVRQRDMPDGMSLPT